MRGDPLEAAAVMPVAFVAAAYLLGRAVAALAGALLRRWPAELEDLVA